MANNVGKSIKNQTLNSFPIRLVWVSLLAVLAATAANLGLYFAAGILLPEVTAWPGAGPAQIAGANLVYLFIGAVVLSVVRRVSVHPARHYLVIAVIGLFLSLALPILAGFGYGPPGTPTAGVVTVIILCLMHVVTFAISVPMFIRQVSD